jgi:glutathione S-transferase
MERTLFYIPFSPWSLKARFALAHHGLRVTEREYAPLFDELPMRVRLKKPRGRISVPVLLTPEGPLTDSWEIALYADRVGSGAPLMPSAERTNIADWNAASERLLNAGRARSMLRAVNTPAAIREALPRPLRNAVGQSGRKPAPAHLADALALLVGRVGVRVFNRKYGIREEDSSLHQKAMRLELDHLRKALAGGRPYLLDQFSYADVTMALGLQVLDPLPETPLAPEARQVGTDHELSESYSDLLRWRDSIHARHRLVAS